MAGSGDIPRWINFKNQHTQKAFERFKTRTDEHLSYWIVRYKKHGNVYQRIQAYTSYETTWIVARNELGAYKYKGFDIEWAQKDVSALMDTQTMSVPTIQSVWSERVDQFDLAINSGNPQRLNETMDELLVTQAELAAMSMVLDDRIAKAKKKIRNLFS
jgi:hypothetical protein